MELLLKIKSDYIFYISFSFLNEKYKLNIIRYNKVLQKKLNIDINYFKKISGKYKIIVNGKGKEYLLDKNYIIFSGEYKNGKKNGKGKEYNEEGDLIFEGNYLNGKRNGKGIEYNKVSTNTGNRFEYYKFEGEYLNGLKNGFGKLYIDNELIFEGNYSNNERNGEGKEYYPDNNLLFEGKYLNNKKWEGKGYNNSGQFEYEIKNGFGYIKEFYEYGDRIKYEGEYAEGEKNGIGKEYDRGGNIIFEGNYLNNKRNGKGKEYNFNKRSVSFEGEYKNGKRWNVIGYNDKGQIACEIKEGNGILKEFFNDGKIYFEGEYKNGERNGKGKQYQENFKPVTHSLEYEGEYLNGKKNGYGKLFYLGPNTFEGVFLNDSFLKGKAKTHERRGCDFEGEYLNGKKRKGKIIRANYFNRKIMFEGEYKDGIIWQGQGYDPHGNKDFEIKNGKGIFKIYEEKLIFEGEYNNGNINGKVIAYGYFDEKFEGFYLNGKKSGKGKEYDEKGNLRFEGDYFNGKKNGKGKEYDEKGNLIYEGEYINGEKDIEEKKENDIYIIERDYFEDIFK